jgi:hypothetical protein
MREHRRGRVGHPSWYLLIHQLPPRPLYLRAKIRQRLSNVGAVALKNSVYALPRRNDCLENLESIAQEAVTGGGEAYVCEAEFSEARTDEALRQRFRAGRDSKYQALARAIREWIRKAQRRSGANPPEDDLPARLVRARKRFEEIARHDFFDAPTKRDAARLLRDLERQLRSGDDEESRGARAARSELPGRTWATRRGIHIDRIASAWLICRFIDPKARFRFIDPKELPRPGELRFDMVGGDFSHEGDRCTFETLVARTGVANRALTEIAEIVHDIDLKDGKFGRAEAAGLEQLLIGLLLANPEDDARLERGFVLFDELHQSFRKQSPRVSKEVSE